MENAAVKILSLHCGADTVYRVVELTESPFERMRGLIGRNGLPVGHAMWFDPCASVHTCFMRFRVDLVFLSRDLIVTDVRTGVKPWRAVFAANGARSVLEAQTGWLRSEYLQIGTQYSQMRKM